MNNLSIDYIAWWGAALSTLLAVIKLWEIWRDRFRISVGCNLTSNPEIGNEIFIRNLSSRPIILSHWELLHGHVFWPYKKLSLLIDSEPDSRDIILESHGSKTLSFTEQHHFNLGSKPLRDRKIYIRIHVVGKGAIIKKVYG